MNLLRAALRSSRVFYNRSEELKGLRDMMSGRDGSMLLVTGPRDSGKSALLSEFMSREHHHNLTYPILIDMRSGKYDTAASFASELKAQTMSKYVPDVKKFVKAAKEAMGDGPLEKLLLHVAESVAAVENTEETDMQGLLKGLEALFVGWESLYRLVARGEGGYPTLVIDEANKLLEWSLATEEAENLKALKNWLIMVTKQMGVANVILCSSDHDLFKFWMMGSHIGNNRYLVGVVGDLVEDEAFGFFQEQLSGKDLPPELWKEVYGYVGGRINLLKQVAAQLLFAGDDDAALWEAWGMARNFLHAKSWSNVSAGMHPHELPLKWTSGLGNTGQVDGVTPAWTPDEFMCLLEKLTAAEGGVCSMNELCNDVRNEALYSLIQHNFLHYREGSVWGGRDLRWYRGQYPIVMPSSLPIFHAMKDVFQIRQ